MIDVNKFIPRSILFKESNHQRHVEFTVTTSERLLVITNTVGSRGVFETTNIFLEKDQVNELRKFLGEKWP